MSKLIKAPNSCARRRIGRSLSEIISIAVPGSPGCTCEYNAEILTERFNCGTAPRDDTLLLHGGHLAVSRTSNESKLRYRTAYWSASASLTTASPSTSTV